MTDEMPGQQTTDEPSGPSWNQPTGRTWKDRLNSVGDDVSHQARRLVDEGNQRQIVIEHNGRSLVNMPVTVAAVIGGVTVLIAPAVAVIGFIGALLAKVSARVEPRH